MSPVVFDIEQSLRPESNRISTPSLVCFKNNVIAEDHSLKSEKSREEKHLGI